MFCVFDITVAFGYSFMWSTGGRGWLIYWQLHVSQYSDAEYRRPVEMDEEKKWEDETTV